MSAGTFDVGPRKASPGGRAPTVACCLYDPDAEEPFRRLENVACETIQFAEGPAPPTARFRYLLDELAAADGFPTRFERLWPASAAGKGVVRPDDRIVVLTWTAQGRREVLFDGFAQIPQVDVDGESQAVAFSAVGVAARCFDRPVSRRAQRDAGAPTVGAVIRVDLPVRFNPEGRPNRTPDGSEVDAGGPGEHHAFLDDRISRDPDPRAYWTLADAARYLLTVHADEEYVERPDLDVLDSLLESRRPKDGAPGYDPSRPSTYDADPIVVRDYDATNKAWPDALSDLLSYAGFGMRWAVEADESGGPWNRLEIYRKDAVGEAPRPLLLDRFGAELDPSRNTVQALALSRDLNAVVNAFELDVPPGRVEASFVLAPGFTPTAGDESASQRVRFLAANLEGANAADLHKYRRYLLDEAGEGHWDGTAWAVGSTPDLGMLFKPGKGEARAYVDRRRKPEYELFSVDADGEPLRARLMMSRDYAGPAPGVWDGTGTWQPVAGGWELLDDRVGIRVTIEDPESWDVGDYTGDHPQEKGKKLRGVTSQANPSGANTRFVLMLTCVVDSDRSPTWSAAKRPASPTRFERRRRIDARENFRRDTIAKSSLLGVRTEDVDARDDEADALTHASQLRAANERPPLVGSAKLPFLDLAHRVGGRVDRVRGREASFRSDAGSGGDEAPSYPRIVRKTWTFAGGVETVLHFTDREIEAQAL